jgi:NAD-dependent deacetylase
LEMNLEPSLASYMFDESRIGRAGELVPAWVDQILSTQSVHSSPMSR